MYGVTSFLQSLSFWIVALGLPLQQPLQVLATGSAPSEARIALRSLLPLLSELIIFDKVPRFWKEEISWLKSGKKKPAGCISHFSIPPFGTGQSRRSCLGPPHNRHMLSPVEGKVE